MQWMVILGAILFLLFFLAWAARNVFKYMYSRQSHTFNRVLWLVILPISAIGLTLLLVGGLVHF